MTSQKYYSLDDYNVKILASAFPIKLLFTPIIKKNVPQLREKNLQNEII